MYVLFLCSSLKYLKKATKIQAVGFKEDFVTFLDQRKKSLKIQLFPTRKVQVL